MGRCYCLFVAADGEGRRGRVGPLLRKGELWLLEPVRPGEAAIPLDLDRFNRSGLFGVVLHAVHHLNKPRLRRI